MSAPSLWRKLFGDNTSATQLLSELLPWSSKAPLALGSASAGKAEVAAREDHVHPLPDKLLTARTIDGISFDGSANIHHYGTCSTAAATVAKVVSLDKFVLTTGAEISVKFSATNTAGNPTLNVNNTGAKAIRYKNAAPPSGYLVANKVYRLLYDGTYWQVVGDIVEELRKQIQDLTDKLADTWNLIPLGIPQAVVGVRFGGSDGRRAIMPGESTPRENWVLCDGGSDGNGGTVPDLRGRMIIGASDAYKAGSTGGSAKHSHSLSGTVGATTLTEAQMPSHTHTFGIGTYGSSAEAKGNTSSKQRTDATGGSQAHTHTLEGASDEVSNIPPYYALSFIMRTA